MTRGAEQPRARVERVHRADVHGVERVHVEDGLHVIAAAREPVEVALDRLAQGIRVEEYELSVRASDQGGVRSDVDDAGDLERAPDIPEAVRDGEDGGVHRPVRERYPRRRAVATHNRR